MKPTAATKSYRSASSGSHPADWEASTYDEKWSISYDERGAPLAVKVEGLAAAGDRVLATVDADDPDRPSELLEIVLGGPWPARPGPG